MSIRLVAGGILGALAFLQAPTAAIDGPRSRPVQTPLQHLLRSQVRQDDRGARVTATESYIATLPLSPTGSFILSNASGNVVIAGAGDEVRIEAVKRAVGNDEDDARRKVQAIWIDVAINDGTITVKTTVPEGTNAAEAVDFTIMVPATVAVTAHAFLGDMRISNVSGPVAASTVSGHLTMSALGDVRTASTISGDIEIRASLGTQVSVAALSATVTVTGLTASSLDLDVRDGKVTCVDVRANRAYLRTDRGDLDYSGPLARGGIYQVQSQSGHVRFTPTGTTGFGLDASSFRGNTRSQFPVPADSATPGRQGLTQAISATVGDGSASVTLRSLSGDVTLNQP